MAMWAGETVNQQRREMITEAYPLQWPMGRSRTVPSKRRHGQFKVNPVQIRRDLLKELNLMGVTSYVINSNSRLKADGMPYANQYIDDTGVVLYFTRKGQEIAIACDKYYHVNDNLRAISLTLGAIRGMERWGTEEMVDRAFTGFTALPEAIIPNANQKRAWYDVLEVSQTASPEVIRAAYRQKMLKAHPDHGGSDAAFAEVQSALKESGA